MTTMSPSSTRENRYGGGRPGAAGAKAGPEKGAKEKGGDGGDADKSKGALLKSKKVLIALLVVVLVGAGGAYKFALPHHPSPPAAGEVVPMDAMTLNLAGGHYLKVAVAVQLVKGKATATNFDTSHAAELVINQFSNRTVASLSSNSARQTLSAQLLASLRSAYPGEVYAIFLTQFVTQ